MVALLVGSLDFSKLFKKGHNSGPIPVLRKLTHLSINLTLFFAEPMVFQFIGRYVCPCVCESVCAI